MRWALLLIAVALQVSWERQDLPASCRLFHALLVALSVWRPDYGLLAGAAFMPLAADLWRLLGPVPDHAIAGLGTAVDGSRWLEQLALSVLTGALMRWDFRRSRLALPALLSGIIALASAIVVLPSRVFAAAPEQSVSQWLAAFWMGTDLTHAPEWRPLFFARYAIEGLVLACIAETAVRKAHGLIWKIVAMSMAAYAGLTVLGAISLGVFNSAESSTILMQLRSVRVTRSDPNALGSALVLVILAAIGFLRRGRHGRVATIAVMPLLLAGLWFTGSRAALAAVPIALLAALWMGTAVTHGRAIRIGAITLICVVTCAIVMAMMYTGRRNNPMSFTVATRVVLIKAGLRMTASAPVFGIGLGTFWDRSVDFGTNIIPDIARKTDVWQPNPHENAHNNFVQILAEQGIAGFMAFCLVLWTALAPALARPALTSDAFWILAGIGGFMVTWLTGHPLLAPEAAFVFWLYLGALAGLCNNRAPGRMAPWVWLSFLVVLSIPARVFLEERTADYSHVALGMSDWQNDKDGGYYRVAERQFALFVPTNRFVTVPLRLEAGTPSPVELEIRSGDKLVNRVSISGDAWQLVPLQLPSKSYRFVRLDFLVRSASTLPPAPLRVGWDESH